MAGLNLCGGCGAQIVVHSTTIDNGGNIVHEGNEWIQDPYLCEACKKRFEEVFASSCLEPKLTGDMQG